MAGTAQQFGSAHTARKLEAVQKYLNAFTTALKNKGFELLYVDACAGSGFSQAKSETKQGQLLEAEDITVGSAIRALEIARPFDRYVLTDVKQKNVRSLNSVIADGYPELSDRVSVMQADANRALIDLCEATRWRSTRAVVFLDPFGLQLDFSMVWHLAKTKAVDLWYLVPVGGMSRQIKGDGTILEPGGSRIDAILGTRAWRKGAIAEEGGGTDLFGPIQPSIKKVANSGWFEQVAIDQLASVFEGGVLDQALPLGKNGRHEFSLVFACANPKPAANVLAKKFAAAVLK